MIWKCNTCGKTKDVGNGYCEHCGPVQTTPADPEAMRVAGVAVSQPQEKKLEE